MRISLSPSQHDALRESSHELRHRWIRGQPRLVGRVCRVAGHPTPLPVVERIGAPTVSATPEQTAAPAPGAPEVPSRRLGRPKVRLALVGVVIVAAVGFLLIKGLGSSLDYFKTVDQALASKQTLGTTEFRLEGLVKSGSVQRTSTGASFDVAQGDRSVHVVNHGSPPQLFKAGMPVIVVGHFTSAASSTFTSNEIMVKHTSSYIEQNPTRVKASDG